MSCNVALSFWQPTEKEKSVTAHIIHDVCQGKIRPVIWGKLWLFPHVVLKEDFHVVLNRVGLNGGGEGAIATFVMNPVVVVQSCFLEDALI